MSEYLILSEVAGRIKGDDCPTKYSSSTNRYVNMYTYLSREQNYC